MVDVEVEGVDRVVVTRATGTAETDVTPTPPGDGYSIREFNEWRQSNAGWQILNIKYYFYYF